MLQWRKQDVSDHLSMLQKRESMSYYGLVETFPTELEIQTHLQMLQSQQKAMEEAGLSDGMDENSMAIVMQLEAMTNNEGLLQGFMPIVDRVPLLQNLFFQKGDMLVRQALEKFRSICELSLLDTERGQNMAILQMGVNDPTKTALKLKALKEKKNEAANGVTKKPFKAFADNGEGN
jgi:hypothetical protein